MLLYLLAEVLSIQELYLEVNLRFEVLTEVFDERQPMSIAKQLNRQVDTA
jgi:hypothetical protein